MFSSGCFSSSTPEIHQDHPPRNFRFVWLKPHIAVERLGPFINLWETCDTNLVRKLVLWVRILVVYVSSSRHTHRDTTRNLKAAALFTLYPSRYLLSVLQFNCISTLHEDFSAVLCILFIFPHKRRMSGSWELPSQYCASGAGKSLARPTSQCRRMESIVLERGVCSCAELQVFPCYRGWKEACQATRAISITWRRELSIFFFPARQGVEGNSRHSDRNIRGTCTIVCHRQTWVAQFKRGDFSTYDVPRPGRPETVTTSDSIDQIHELILEDHRFRLNQ